MAHAGQIALFRFPQTDLRRGKLRPAVLTDDLADLSELEGF